MILGGGQCQKCKCIPCDQCTSTCTEPHTGDAFEAVYTLYSLGEEIGNTSDGYLTASGDVDASDPYDGMDGSSPWYQQIEGGFTIGGTQTRFPCVARFSFWRSTFPLGAVTFPPSSSALTESTITVTCTGGKIRFGEDILEDGESKTFNVTFPVVTGTGDQSGNDPRTSAGTFDVSTVCREASFSITARIEWTVSKRQHVLYGIVRECYEEDPIPCGSPCTAQNQPPNVMYITISNVAFSKPVGAGSDFNWLNDPVTHTIEGTYVIERVAGLCTYYEGRFPIECKPSNVVSNFYGVATVGIDTIGRDSTLVSSWSLQTSVGARCEVMKLIIAKAGENTFTDRQNCGALPITGTGSNIYRLRPDDLRQDPELPIGTFSWSIDD